MRLILAILIIIAVVRWDWPPASQPAISNAEPAHVAKPELPEAPLSKDISVLATPLVHTTELAAFKALVEHLATLGSPDDVDALIKAWATHEDPAMRQAVLEAFDLLSQPESSTLLVSALAATDDAALTQAVIRTIARTAVADTVDFLVELYTEPGALPARQQRMVTAMRSISNAPAIAALGDGARLVAHPELAAAAADALAKMGRAESILALRSAWQALPDDAAHASQRAYLLTAFGNARITGMNGPLIALDAEADEPSPWQAVAARLTTTHRLLVQTNTDAGTGGSIAAHSRHK